MEKGSVDAILGETPAFDEQHPTISTARLTDMHEPRGGRFPVKSPGLLNEAGETMLSAR